MKMMQEIPHKYGTFTAEQIEEAKKEIRKQIIFLLSIVDPELKEEYQFVDVNAAYHSLLDELSGMNELLGEPAELVIVMSLLVAALNEYNSEDFAFSKYRKLVLDAGAKVNSIKGVSPDANSQ